MTPSDMTKGTPSILLFVCIRMAALFSAFGFIDLSALPIEKATLYFDRFLRAFTVLLFWNLAEGVMMLWVREKNRASERSRGYGAVACILGIVVLVLLQSFRTQAAQAQFLLMLAILALRGMSRSSWEQGRPHAAALLAPASHTLLALLSFCMVLENWSWQLFVISLTVGGLTGAVETTWHAASFDKKRAPWVLPLYRLSISFPAVAIGSLSLIRQLPSSYIITLAYLLVSTRFTWNKGKGGELRDHKFVSLCGLYLLFTSLVAIALIFS